MPTEYHLRPAHRRKLRRLRALVGASAGGAEVSAEEYTQAVAYLEAHATCEAYALAVEAGTTPAARPRCAQAGRETRKPSAWVETRVCPVCMKEKALVSFDGGLGMCVKCKYAGKRTALRPRGSNAVPPATKYRKCRVCLQRVVARLVDDEWLIEPHMNARTAARTRCPGSRETVYREKRDALDYRAPGSFEGGGRR